MGERASKSLAGLVRAAAVAAAITSAPVVLAQRSLDAPGSGAGAAGPGPVEQTDPSLPAAEDGSTTPTPEVYGPPPITPPEVRWRVKNSFRLFADPADTDVHRATFEALTARERRNPILSAERALGLRFPDGWAASVIDKTCWNADRNRHECPGEESAYATPETHTVLARLSTIPDAHAVGCTWLTAPKGGRIIRGEAVTRACNAEVELSIPYPDGADVEVRIGDRRVAQTSIEVRDLLIVGMGDSFGSGEGNPDVPVRFSRERTATYGNAASADSRTGYPARVGDWRTVGDKRFIAKNARWLDQACHRSLYSHQLRAALQLAIEDPHRAVTFVGLACSGAEITAGLFLRYKGNEWVPNPPGLSQISAAAVAQCGENTARARDMPEAYHIGGAVSDLEGGLVLHKCDHSKSRKIDLVFLSVGGNDIGFARLLANAILVDQSLLKQLGGWLGQVHGQSEAALGLGMLDERYKALNRALHGILHIPWGQADRVILTAYPGLALLGDGSEVCPDGTAGMDVVSSFKLSAARAREGVWVADKLNRKMAGSARRHGWTFVERHRRDFIGRGICAGFVNSAFSVADDLRLPRFVNGRWVPYNPADYRPYASRQRWFRTPNDAFMTSNFHVSEPLMQKVLKLESFSWFQLLLASTYSGAFHPTAEGHAAIADAVADQARAVLHRYQRGNGSNMASP